MTTKSPGLRQPKSPRKVPSWTGICSSSRMGDRSACQVGDPQSQLPGVGCMFSLAASITLPGNYLDLPSVVRKAKTENGRKRSLQNGKSISFKTPSLFQLSGRTTLRHQTIQGAVCQVVQYWFQNMRFLVRFDR